MEYRVIEMHLSTIGKNPFIKIITDKLTGLMGSTKAEVCKNIILAYLSEKSYIKTETSK